MDDSKRQVVVIGGGAGGLYISNVLAKLGYKVTLVEKADVLGGDCLHYGCVPSKAFIKVAKMAFNAINSERFGIINNRQIDFPKVISYVNDVVSNVQKHEDPRRIKSHGIEVLFGSGHFVGEHTLSVDDRLIAADKFIIATGSRPKIPNINGINDVNYYTNENILRLEQQPKKLVIIGGGTIGLEYAQAFARLGTKVVILEANDVFMPNLDQIQMNNLMELLTKQGVEFIKNVNISQISKTDDGSEIKFDIVIYNNTDNTSNTRAIMKETIIADGLLVATGREPNVDHLGLNLIGIDYNKNGVVVDDYLRTARKHIYAIGDAIDSPYKFTHMAEYHAGIVIKNMAFKFPTKVNYSAVPMVTYTDPEWAQVGLSEYEANEKNITYQVLHYPLANLDRAIIDSDISGSVKLLVKRNRLLGASILSPMAGELIHELSLALNNNISLKKITQTIHAYPTWSQMHKKAINQYFEPKVFNSLLRFYVRFMQLFE